MGRSSTLSVVNGILVLGVLLVAAGSPRASGEVLVLSPRWLGFPSAFAVVSNADGVVVAANATDSAAIGQSPDPHFADKLYQAGALLVLRAPRFAACIAGTR